MGCQNSVKPGIHVGLKRKLSSSGLVFDFLSIGIAKVNILVLISSVT